MRKLSSSGLTALFAALAVIAASFPLGGLSAGLLGLAPSVAPAASVTTVASSAPISAGTITLSTSHHKGVVTWGDVKQEFGNSPLGNCVLTPKPGTKSLLDFVGYNGKISSSAGFKKGFVGVYTFSTQGGPPSNAAHCEQVDDGGPKPSNEMLGVHLGADAKDTFGALVATKATLQLVANSNKGSAVATLVDAESNALSTKTVSWTKKGTLTLTVNGELSGILLKVTKGSFSLKGATFDVASQADDFFCTPGSDDTFTNDDGVTVEFIGNADGSACEGFGIKLGRDGDAQVHFIKPLDVNPEAQFIFAVPWDTIALISPSMMPPVLIDFEVPEPYGPNEHEMPFCPDYLFNGPTLVGMPSPYPGARADLDSRDMETDVEGVIQTIGTQFACIGDRDTDISKSSGPGFEATITDLIYLIGDARMLMR